MAAIINKLTAELETVLAKHEMTKRQTNSLQEQLITCEARLQQVEQARAAGEKIALGISDLAAERVRLITDDTHRILRPQHEQLASIGREIAFLSRELTGGNRGEDKAPVADPAPLEIRREYSWGEPGQALGKVEDSQSELESIVKREYSLREPEPMVKREFSLREPEYELHGEENLASQPVEPAGSDPALLGKREYSLREPEYEDFDEEKLISVPVEPAEADPAPQVKREYSLREPEDLALPAEAVETVALDAGEPDMRFDVFVEGQHFETVDGVGGPIHKHSWQVKIEVEVPRNNYHAKYSAVLAAITSVLMRYDEVLINEVFPFTLIEPSTENISMYLYNCVEDNLALMSLNLKNITLGENSADEITVQTRNVDFDTLLNCGEDPLGDIRTRLHEPDDAGLDQTLKRLLGQVFKPKNDHW